MMAVEPNRTALAVVRAILDAAHPLELTIQGTRVRCEVGRLPPEPWPGPMRGLSEDLDGPWPDPVAVTCTDDTGCNTNQVCAGGECVPRVTCAFTADCPTGL